MSNASHRKPGAVSLPRIPVAYLVTGGILVALVAAILATLALVTAPTAKAGTGYLSPAVTAGKGLHLKPTVQAYTQFLEEGGSFGLGVNTAALPWF